MKEATGELNMTVVTVVAIAAVAAFFYAFIWPNIKTSITTSTKCASATCPNSCTSGSTCACQYIEANGSVSNVTCKIQN